jgi:hypothetical protein
MAPNRPLYAWAVPAFTTGSPVDHTWVTTYDNRVHAYPDDRQVAAAGESYWYCWGSFHATGGTPGNPTGFLGTQAGDVAMAQCLVVPNADTQHVVAARGTIFTYGVDGVCHQLANQVLYATGIGSVPPMTVQGSRGYFASTFVYGTYGLKHRAWIDKIRSCGAPQVVSAAGGVPMAGQPDEFEARARAVLEGDPDTLARLLALRVEAQRSIATQPPGAIPPAEALNAQNQRMFDEAARILGAQRFEAIFGFPPGAKIDLVDPTIERR